MSIIENVRVRTREIMFKASEEVKYFSGRERVIDRAYIENDERGPSGFRPGLDVEDLSSVERIRQYQEKNTRLFIEVVGYGFARSDDWQTRDAWVRANEESKRLVADIKQEIETLNARILAGKVRPEVFIENGLKMEREYEYACYLVRLQEIGDLQLFEEIKTHRTNKDNSYYNDPISGRVCLQTKKEADDLRGCEFELARRIMGGQMVTAPEGYEDIFQEFQVAVRAELAKEKIGEKPEEHPEV
jgi:hypothetical protein